jgi:hypothetical protein
MTRSAFQRRPQGLVLLGLLAGWALVACTKAAPGTGAAIEVLNGPGVPAPEYLQFDWRDGETVLIHARRVPEVGALDPAATPLATVRIAVTDVARAERRFDVWGMIGDERVSEGVVSVQIASGQWQPATVVLSAAERVVSDAGIEADGATTDGGAQADAQEDLALAADLPVAVSPDAAEGSVAPPDAGGAADLAIVSPPDVARDVAPDAAPAVAVALAAVADTFVENGESAAKNFGAVTTLQVKTQTGNDNSRIALFRFSIPQSVGAFTTATLRVYGRSDTGPTSDSVYAVMDGAWTETGVTWNNKPALGNKLATAAITTTPQYHDWTVSAFARDQVAAGHTINLAITMDASTAASPDTFNSREATGNPPLLLLSRGP